MTKQSVKWTAAVAVLALVVFGAGCGGDDDDDDAAAATPTDEFDSAYCDTVRDWAVSELTLVEDDDPAALEQYMGEYVEFAETSLEQTPDVIREQHEVNVDGLNNTLIPVLEKYDYDVERLFAEGTAEEQSLANEPPPDIRDAQTAIIDYERDVCGSQQPAAADVAFEADENTEAYCESVGNVDGPLADVLASGADPGEVRDLVTSADFEAAIAVTVENAPEPIAEDAAAVADWLTEHEIPLLAEYDYDLLQLLVEGTQGELAIVNDTDPEIAEQFARSLAYEEQLCG